MLCIGRALLFITWHPRIFFINADTERKVWTCRLSTSCISNRIFVYRYRIELDHRIELDYRVELDYRIELDCRIELDYGSISITTKEKTTLHFRKTYRYYR